jgi:hypothetical protein
MIYSKAVFDAQSPVAMYATMLGTTMVRNVVLCGIFKYLFARYPKFTAYCQKNGFTASLLRWKNTGRLLLPLIDFAVQIGVVQAMARAGVTVQHHPTLHHSHIMIESWIFNWLRHKIPLGNIIIGAQPYIPMSLDLVNATMKSDSVHDYLVSQAPMMMMNLVSELVGVFYRGWIDPASAKRTVGADLAHVGLQWPIATLLCTVLAPIPVSKFYCRVRGRPFTVGVLYGMQVPLTIVSNFAVEVFFFIAHAMYTQFAQQEQTATVPEAPEAGPDPELSALERQQSVDVSSLPPEQVEYLENLEKEFGRIPTPALDEVEGACSRASSRTEVRNSVRLASIFTYLRLNEYRTAVNMGFLRRGLTLENIQQVVKCGKVSIRPSETKLPQQCSICLANIDEDSMIGLLKCQHYFHQECITEWLQRKKRCPMCRTEAEKKDDSVDRTAFGEHVENSFLTTEGLIPDELEYAPWNDIQEHLNRDRGVQLEHKASEYEAPWSMKDVFFVFGIYLLGGYAPDYGGEN